MFLAIPATSASAERVFSIAGWVFDQRRRSMDAERLSQLVEIHQHGSVQDIEAIEAAFSELHNQPGLETQFK